MKYLLKAAKVIFFVFLLCLVLAGLTALSWWLHWPLFTGFYIIAGIAALLLLLVAGRRIYEWRDKKAFIRSVRQAAPAKDTDMGANPLESVWNMGFGGGKVHLRAGQGLQQGWSLVFDETASSSELFDSLCEAVPPARQGAPIVWQFGHAGKLLQFFSDEERRKGHAEVWDNLLALASCDQAARSLRSVVVLVSLAELNELDATALRERGYILRHRLQELMLCVNASLPVFVLAQGLDEFPGGGSFLGRLSESVRQARLGEAFDGEIAIEDAVSHAFATARATLSGEFGKSLLDFAPAQGDELLFWSKFLLAEEKFAAFMEPLAGPSAHHEKLGLRGVFFSGNQKTSPADPVLQPAKPAFLPEFLTRVLPQGAFGRKALRGRFSMFGPLKVYGYAAWLLALISICGLLGANMLFQGKAIAYRPTAVLQPKVENFPELTKQMDYILHLEQAKESWLLPTLGLNMLERRLVEEKVTFSHAVFDKVLLPRLALLRSIFTADSLSREKQMSGASEFFWFCANVSERLENGLIPTANSLYPLTVLSEDMWSMSTGLLLKNALNWVDNRQQIMLLEADLRNLLLEGLQNESFNFLEAFFSYYDEKHKYNRKCLSQYWPNLENDSSANMCIPVRYTAEGNAAMHEHFDDLLLIGRNSDLIQIRLKRFIDDYHRGYAKHWEAFIMRFTEEATASTSSADFRDLSPVAAVESLPHVQLLRDMKEEMKPLSRSKLPPLWLDDLSLFSVLLDVALDLYKDRNEYIVVDLVAFGLSEPKRVRTLWEHTQNPAKMRESLAVIELLTVYFRQLNEIARSIHTPAVALPLANLHFAGTDAETLKNSPFTLAKNTTQEIAHSFDRLGFDHRMHLLENALRYLQNGVTIQAAGALQDEWENNVLASPENLYEGGNTEILYGKGGLIGKFKETKLMPFLRRTTAGLTRASWDDIDFPFTNDFLVFLTSSEVYGAMPEGKHEHSVTVHSQPPQVNIDARERPDTVTLALQCEGGVQKLVNKNYPRTATFNFAHSGCRQATLSLVFPSFSLSLPYEDFPSFIEAFQYGENTFTPASFASSPESVKAMETANVKEIKLFFLPDDILGLLRERDIQSTVIPDRITYAW
jgi:Uncharacterized protein conserved in bacteria